MIVPGKRGAKATWPAPLGGEVGDEEAAAGQAALQAGEEAAAGVGVHRTPSFIQAMVAVWL